MIRLKHVNMYSTRYACQMVILNHNWGNIARGEKEEATLYLKITDDKYERTISPLRILGYTATIFKDENSILHANSYGVNKRGLLLN